MMRTLLTPLAQDLADGPALEGALLVAKRMNSHIRAMFVRPDPDLALRYVPEVIAAAGVTRDTIESNGRRAAAAGKARFDSWRLQHDLPEEAGGMLDSRFATWSERTGEIEAVVTHYGRVSDLIVVTKLPRNNVTAERCFDAAVFGTGRPTLVVPEQLPWDIIDHVLIAWNGSLEASRAVFGAMPLLHSAQRVSIFGAPEESGFCEPAELAGALSWHGIHAVTLAQPEAHGSTGAALLEAARCHEATLIVMGAYTHSRLRQAFLGGVTRHVLFETAIPVLMGH